MTIYTPKSIVLLLSKEGINIRPKKVRRIMRGLYPNKSSKMWELDKREFNKCLAEVKKHIRDCERSSK